MHAVPLPDEAASEDFLNGLKKLGGQQALFRLEGLGKVAERGVTDSECRLCDIRASVQKACCGVDADSPQVLLQGFPGVSFNAPAEVWRGAAAGRREGFQVESVFVMFFEVCERTICELVRAVVLLNAKGLLTMGE